METQASPLENPPSPPPSGGSADPSTHFVFQHKIFTIPNCRFSLNGADKLPCFCVPIGEVVAAMELRKINEEFPLPAEDAALLKTVEKGLKYVREIRPNDSIPREILDGSASWTVEERHKQQAKARLNTGLIFWITGVPRDSMALEDMQRMQNQPENREQLRDAYLKIAKLTGLKDANAATARADIITRETPYIEALMERNQKLEEILQKLSAFASAFRKESAFIAENMRMQDLVRRAHRLIADHFARVDNLLRDPVQTLGDPPAAIGVIRQARDEANVELNKWDEHINTWREMRVERDDASEKYFRKFYQFLAENYMEQKSWGSTIGAVKKK